MININLREYWNNRAFNYNIFDAFGRKILKAHLKLISPLESLVEAGCGRGALFKLYKDVPRVLGLDFSKGMMEFARAKIDNWNLDNIELKFFHLGLEKWDPSNERFDLALTRTVLMHIPPKQIMQAAENLTKMSDNLIIFEYYDNTIHDKLAFHNWLHDYIEIFKSFNYTLKGAYQRPDMRQTLFRFVKENGRKDNDPD